MNARRIAKDFPVVCVGGSAGGLDAYIHYLHLRRIFVHLQGTLDLNRVNKVKDNLIVE